MNIKISIFFFSFTICGFLSEGAFAGDKRILLEPILKYSYCTPWESGYSLGIVGDTWALTLSLPKSGFSGKMLTQDTRFYRGPNIHWYIGRSAGPRRPPIPKTNAYTTVNLIGITVNIKRIKIWDEIMGPIEVVVNDFSSNGEIFYISDPVNIFCLGPLP